jgi:hypothetical protein
MVSRNVAIGHREDAAAIEVHGAREIGERAASKVDLVGRIKADPDGVHATSARIVSFGQL